MDKIATASDEPLIQYVQVPAQQMLTREQEKILSKGLRFQITPKKVPDLDKYIMELAKQVNIRYQTNRGYTIADNVFLKLQAVWKERRTRGNLTCQEMKELQAIKNR